MCADKVLPVVVHNAESVRWEPEIPRYWFCRSEGHVITSDTQDEMDRCPAKVEFDDPCGGVLFGPCIRLEDAREVDTDDE